MAGPEALSVQGEGLVTSTDPTATAEAAAVPASSAAAPRWPQLIPIAQLIAVILGVLAIIWNQQQTIDSLRTELTADINRVETGLNELRTEVVNNGQRLARIEGFLGIDIADDPPQ